MISLILIIIAAICNAVCDTLKDHFPVSIFSRLNQQWWNPNESWKNKYVYDKQTNWKKYIPDSLSDAWHCFKTIMIFSLIGAVVCYVPNYYNWVYFIVYGLNWNFSFNLFYNHILIK